jgi:hypothetical protein
MQMKPSTKRTIAAILVAAVIIVFPFRTAFIESAEPGIKGLVSFLLTLAGVFVFYYLTMPHEPRHEN